VDCLDPTERIEIGLGDLFGDRRLLPSGAAGKIDSTPKANRQITWGLTLLRA